MEQARTASGHKLLAVLEALGASVTPQRLGEIAAASGMTKPTAHRLLRLLTDEGWAVAHDSGYYRLGPRARALGRQADPASADSIEELIRSLADEVGQTVHVGMLTGNEVMYTHKAAGPQPFSMRSGVGMRIPLHSTGIGKAVLAWHSEAEVRAFTASKGLPRLTPNTITDIDDLLEHLAVVREQGYATDMEENEQNVRCIAVPLVVGDRSVGGVSISTISFLTSEEELLGLLPAVQKASLKVREFLV